jgi:hypothetical protein
MHVRMIASPGLSRGKTIALAIAGILIGGVFLVLGLALLASLFAAATIVGAGVMLRRAFRGRRTPQPREIALDPSMEVFPPEQASRTLREPRDS